MLTPAQQRAVDLDAPVILLTAGAGSGKTAVLTARLVRLIRSGVDPSAILASTFTRAAAGEMRERIAAILAPEEMRGLVITTIHAWCQGLLRRFPGAMGRDHDFSVYDEVDLEDIQTAAMADLNVPETTWSGATTTRSKKPEVRAAKFRQAERLHDEVARRLREWNALSFDLLLSGALKVLCQDPAALAWATRYEHVLVEEAQDTAPLPWQLFRLLAPRCLFVVGDRRQGIYSFQGANLADLDALAAHPAAVALELRENFRSVPAVVDVANTIARGMPSAPSDMVAMRPAAQHGGVTILGHDGDEGRAARAFAVCESLSLDHLVGLPMHGRAVLARRWHSLEPIAAELDRRGVPFWQPNKAADVWRAPGARALLNILRAAVNPRDGWAEEQAVREYVGAEEQVREVRAAARRAGVRLVDLDDRLAGAVRAVAEQQLDAVMAAQLADVAVGLGERYRSTDRTTKAAEVVACLDAIRGWQDAGHGRTVLDLLDWLTHRDLSERVAEGARKGVALLTIHAAKGLEWPVVHLLDWSPQGDADEELRCAYVGATRARDELHIYHYGEASPWLTEVLAQQLRAA